MKNESVKKSLEKSKNVLEEKRKTVKRKICIKKDTHVYYNCYELRSRAIKHGQIWSTLILPMRPVIMKLRNINRLTSDELLANKTKITEMLFNQSVEVISITNCLLTLKSAMQY